MQNTPQSKLVASSNGTNYVKVGRKGHVFFNSPEVKDTYYYIPTGVFRLVEGRRNAIKLSIMFLLIIDRSIERTRSLRLKNFGISGFKPIIHRTKNSSLPIK